MLIPEAAGFHQDERDETAGGKYGIGQTNVWWCWRRHFHLPLGSESREQSFDLRLLCFGLSQIIFDI